RGGTSRGTHTRIFTTAGVSSVYHHWETPAVIAAALHAVCGIVDLDPCAARVQGRREVVRARVRFTPADDGLALPCVGTVFMSPPYGRNLKVWIAKAHREVVEKRAATVIALIPARTDTAYWHTHVVAATGVLFLSGRLKFGASQQSAPFPSAIVVWGGT